jgi:putative PIN family toxin of toxin-antitoxin system
MLRVVIDTSTLVSFALTAGDITRQIIRAWRAEEFTLLTTPATRDELRRVLLKPRIQARSQSSLTWLSAAVDQFSTHVPGHLTVAGVCRDPKDDIFLACAAEGQADYLVSSDRDLLVIRQYQGICIVNPGEFLMALQLTRLTATQIRRAFSEGTLRASLESLCLDAALRRKVDEVLSKPR